MSLEAGMIPGEMPWKAKLTAHIDRAVSARPEFIQIEDAWRKPREQRAGAMQRGHFREIEMPSENLDAERILPCEAARPAIIVYGKRVGTTITVCTDNHRPEHDPKASSSRTRGFQTAQVLVGTLKSSVLVIRLGL
jgi:ParB family transcriptional regulator, chromosome partitioning protein